jgi:hypothetical protein
MPHVAARMLSVNGLTADPAYLAERNGVIAAATNLEELAAALDVDDDNLVAAAQQADSFLPGAVIQAILGAYKAAASSGTDVVHVNWVSSSGFSAHVAHAPGTDAVAAQGVVSVTVKSPPLAD